jgi:alpha-ketoglutarate-dependent taurine dioxygenase
MHSPGMHWPGIRGGEFLMASASVSTRFEVRKLHPAIGAEVRGVDMRKPLDPPSFRALHDIWMEHHVLVFPGQKITDEEHVAFTRHFGEPEIFHQDIIKSRQVAEIFRVSNVDDDGILMPPDHPTVQQVSLAQLWHTDSSYLRVPCNGALLHGVEVSRSGGETQFTNLHLVYDELPMDLKQQVEGRSARHYFGHMHTQRPLKPMTEAEKAKVPPVWQPMVRRHPVTGRKSLYISPIYNDEVEGMSTAEAQRLIEMLTAFAAQPRFVYRHRWEPDDILMWDNRCTMHQVTPFDPTERRVMHRTTIIGEGPVLAG